METILEMRPIEWLVFSLAIGSSAVIFLGITRQEDKSQIAFTWILYSILDIVTMFSSKVEQGSYIMQFGYAIGSFVISIALIYQKRFEWGLLETILSLLILICIIFWQFCGSYWAIRLSIASESGVGAYLIIRTFKNPVIKYNLMGYIICLMSSTTATFAAKDWSVSQMGFPLCETILNVIIIIPLLIKWKKEKKGG